MQTPASAAMKTVRKSKLFRGLIWVAAVMAACLCPTLAFGQTNSTWNGGTGNWSTSTDWTPNQVPNNGGGNTYNVTIASGSVNEDIVILDQNATISSLMLGANNENDLNTYLWSKNGTAVTLNIIGGLTVGQGEIVFGNGDNLTVGGNATINGGVVEIGGSLLVDGTATLSSGGNLILDSGAVANISTLVVSQNQRNEINIAANSTLNLTNQPNGITDIVSGQWNIYGTFNAGSTNGLANLNSLEGFLNLGNLQTTTVTPGSGTLTITDGLNLNGNGTILTILGNLTTSGIVENIYNFRPIEGGTLNVADTLTIQPTGAISFSNGGVINVGGALVNRGVVTLTNGSTISMGASSVNSGTIKLSGSRQMPDSVITGATTGVVLTNEKRIVGGGNIGNGSMGLVNSSTGRVFADLVTPLVIQVSSAGFQNNGTLQINAGSTLTITGAANSFLNFNSSDSTLTGGTYLVTGMLQFDNANIVTSAASITLSGTGSTIEDQNGNNALTNFAANTSAGSFTLAGDRNFSTLGAFSNAGKIAISAGSTFMVGGMNSYKQTAGTTIVSGTLAASSPGGVDISGGSVFGIGTITGNADLTGGLLSAGSASKKAGELTVKGTYAQSGAGAFDVDLGGTTAGTQYDVLNISGTASLGGVLNVDLISGFKPTVGETFDIMDYTSETGAFTTLNLPKLTGGDTWSISYNATGVVLTVDGPAATKGAVEGAPARRVSRGLMADGSADSTREPVAILSRAACFGARMPMAPAACGSESLTTIANGGDRRAPANEGIGSGVVHNNIMVATRSMSGARDGVGRESSASATAMARLYVCAYFPSSVAHTMGCN